VVNKDIRMLAAMLKFLIVCSLAVAAACVQAATGLDELPAQGADGPVTIFYPSSSAEQAVQRGPFTLQAAWRGQAMRGNGHLIVVSHGSGGSAWTYADLARRLVDAGFVVAMPEHQGDNYKDMSKVGPPSWRLRPAEVSRAIDAVAHDERFRPLLDFKQVGIYGMSAGGHAALTLAGGKWSPSLIREHCETHLDDDFQSCVGLALQLRNDAFDGIKKFAARHVIRWRLTDTQWYGHTDPRIRAIVAEVPYAVDFDLATLAKPQVPLGIVQAGQDHWLVPRYHSARVLQACTTCDIVADLPTAGHGSLLSPQPSMLDGTAGQLLRDPPGFDRALVAPAQERIVAFFRRHLLA
jgi:predicted dienelactone hydrolase